MQNLLDPAILFFIFGVVAGTLKSNLEIPQPISRFLSLYLLMALGLKGGFALAHSGLTPQVMTSLGCAVALAVVVPMIGYCVLRRLLSGFDAAAVAATYGSVSAVTFVTAVQTLENQQVAFGGYMSAAMAMMESPAIILAVVFANTLRKRQMPLASSVGVGGVMLATGLQPSQPGVSLGKILHESFTDGAQLLLIGAMVIGILSGDAGKTAMQPFTGDLFKGMLAFFLLDMGLLTARSLPQIPQKSPWLIAYAVLGPLAHASLALCLAWLLKVPAGDGALLMVLAGSASYIAVPAVLRYAIPEANPSLYFGLSLGITFPLNILFGIPLYMAAARMVLT
ncbi:MAG: sodium-dependent bicarbonate transport family permease [Herminiimonas sp.]|nr:sodium-dependent bicarbonate transport family permease [Herminiimonas sp.]